MLNLGGGEMILIVVAGILLIPPKKIPEVATSLGRLLGQLKRNFEDIKSTVHKTLKEEEVGDASKGTKVE